MKPIDLSAPEVIEDLAWTAEQLANLLDDHRQIFDGCRRRPRTFQTIAEGLTAPRSLFVLLWHLERYFSHRSFAKATYGTGTGVLALKTVAGEIAAALGWQELLRMSDKDKAFKQAGIRASLRHDYQGFCKTCGPLVVAIGVAAKRLRESKPPGKGKPPAKTKRRTGEEWEALYDEYQSANGDDPSLTVTAFARQRGIVHTTAARRFERIDVERAERARKAREIASKAHR